jgi:hypothetical protein
MGEDNMPETSEQNAPLELLSDQIQEIFSWYRSRAKCMSLMILAIIRLRSVHLKRLAQEFNPDAQQDSNYYRIQRFFRQVPFAHVKLARWMVDQVRQEGRTVRLYLDRTNWKYGQKISIF